jgi:2-polyprenyl-3-methyl-5-hydroxy-6-metoxy-1,4-benzoquinol methylase
MQTKFSTRSYESELLDAPDIPQKLLFRNLRELDLINRTLGGHSITLSGIRQLLTDKSKTYHVIDIGCGGGDAMKEIAKWSRINGYKVRLTGVDMNSDCITYTESVCAEFPEINGVVSDYRDYLKADKNVDIIHCSLFCHHLKDNELIELFDYMNKYSNVGFIINDLQRNWFAYYSIKYITRLFNGSALVKNDAPLSVLRGFKKDELETLLKKAEVNNTRIIWKWAFRYLVIKNKSLSKTK